MLVHANKNYIILFVFEHSFQRYNSGDMHEPFVSQIYGQKFGIDYDEEQ